MILFTFEFFLKIRNWDEDIEICPVIKYLTVPTFAFLYLSRVWLPIWHEKVLWKVEINSLWICLNIWACNYFISETKCNNSETSPSSSHEKCDWFNAIVLLKSFIVNLFYIPNCSNLIMFNPEISSKYGDSVFKILLSIGLTISLFIENKGSDLFNNLKNNCLMLNCASKSTKFWYLNLNLHCNMS